MPSAYLILLTSALGAGWVYFRSSDDLSFVLAAFTAVICFFWGFALSPWLVQLSIVIGLLCLERFYLRGKYRLAQEQATQKSVVNWMK